MLDITIKNFQKRLPVERAFLGRFIRRVLTLENAGGGGEITVCFVDARAIREINLNYLGRDLPTDVISFDLSRRDGHGCRFGLVADILVSTDAAFSNARIFKTTPRRELLLYIIHGILHLTGYDDSTPKGRCRMQKRQEELLSQCLSIKARLSY